MNKVLNFTLKHSDNKDLYLTTGMTVAVFEKIREAAKERVQKFEGLIIATKGTSINQVITVRKISANSVGVEKTYPVSSPNVVEIKVIKIAKIRRAKLYYMRELTGKKARLNEKFISDKDYQALKLKYGTGPKFDAPVVPEAVADEIQEVPEEEAGVEEITPEEESKEEEKKEEATEEKKEA
jgi:large subunit ribosomal protein L19